MSLVGEDGTVIVCGEDPHLVELAKSTGRHVLSYGFAESNDIVCMHPDVKGIQSDFIVRFEDGTEHAVEIKSNPGRHNMLNATAVLTVAHVLGLDIDAAAIPDLVPILAVCGCAAEGETRIFNAARLRLKESDRLQTVSAAIRALGGDADELPDGLVIRGRALSGGEVDCANDHRIVMSMAMAAMLCGGPVVLDGAEACRKSYPGFFDDYQSLGGIADVL